MPTLIGGNVWYPIIPGGQLVRWDLVARVDQKLVIQRDDPMKSGLLRLSVPETDERLRLAL